MRRKKYLRILIVSYISMLMITLLSATISYSYSKKAIESEIYRINLALATQSIHDIDQQLQQKDFLLSSISLNNQVNNFLVRRAPLSRDEHYSLYSLSEFFAILKNGLSNVDSFFVYFLNSNVIVAPNAVYEPSIFFQNEENASIFDYETWGTGILEQVYHSSSDLFLHPALSESPYLVYKRSLPISVPSRANANIFIYIKKSIITKCMPLLDENNLSSFYLINESNDVVLKSGCGTSLDAQDYSNRLTDSQGFFIVSKPSGSIALTYAKSSQQYWTLVCETPIDTYLQKAVDLKNNLLTVFYITIAIGVILGVVFIIRTYRPVKEIISMIPETLPSMPKSDEMHYIQMTLSNAIERDANHTAIIKKQQPLVYQHLLSRLVDGSLDFSPVTQQLLLESGIDLSKDGFVVCSLRVTPDYEAADQSILIPFIEKFKPNLEKTINGRVYITSDNRGVIAIILNMDRSTRNGDLSDIESIMISLCRDIRDQVDLPVFIGIGRNATKATSIVRSYTQSVYALDAVVSAGSPFVATYDSIVCSDQSYYYPFEIEQQLASFLRAGAESKSQHLLDYLFAENFEKRQLTPEMYRLFYVELLGTIGRVSSEMHFDSNSLLRDMLTNFVDNTVTAKTAKEEISAALTELCDRTEKSKKSHNKPLASRIEKYIQENCCNPDLNLQTVSDAVGLSPAYLSRFFKEQTGETFINYLAIQRVQLVTDLMKQNSKLTMNELADMTGFTNISTFNRVFKKTTGESPSAYRQRISGAAEQ